MTRTAELHEALNKKVDMGIMILQDLKTAKDVKLQNHFLAELNFQLKDIQGKINDIDNFNRVLTISKL